MLSLGEADHCACCSAFLLCHALLPILVSYYEQSRKSKAVRTGRTWIVPDDLCCIQGLDCVEDLGRGALIAAGGLAGTAFWGGMYPIDVVQSKLQTQPYWQPQSRGILDCGRHVLQKEGIHGLYRGLFPCLLRSFPANATSFVAYELAMQAMTSHTAA